MRKLPMAAAVYAYALIFISGLCAGSFLNCFAYRYARRETCSDLSREKSAGGLMKGRSKCAHCGHVLGAWELVPLFTWLLLRGRCRHCGGKIPPVYVLAELTGGIAYVSVALKYDVLTDTLSAVKFLILLSLLLTAALTDIHGGVIPDRLTVIGAAAAFVFALFLTEGTIAASLLRTLISGVSVALPLLIAVLVFDRLMKKETMGGGDIKLMFLIGLYFDWRLNILILILACITGLIYALIRKPGGAFSFAPFPALSAWLVMLWGGGILDWYLGFF